MTQAMRFLPLLWVLVVGAAFIGTARAQDADPQEVVRAAAEAVIQRLEADPQRYRHDTEALYAMVREVTFPHFDLERAAQWVLGRHWRGATPEQRTRFIDEFSTLLLRTYATTLRQYSSADIREFTSQVHFLPLREPEDAKRVTVRTQVLRPGRPPASVDFRLTSRNGPWKVYDVAVEGISLVITYRAEYAGIIQREGIEALIERLSEHNRRRTPPPMRPLS